MTTWLIWTDVRDDNAWNFGTPHNTLPWSFTIAEDTARELFDAPAWAEIKAIVRGGKVAQVGISVDDIRWRTDTSAEPLCGYCHDRSDYAVAEANARRIAAGPELLAAAHHALYTLRMACEHFQTKPDAIAELEAAIAKAGA